MNTFYLHADDEHTAQLMRAEMEKSSIQTLVRQEGSRWNVIGHNETTMDEHRSHQYEEFFDSLVRSCGGEFDRWEVGA